MYLPRSTPAAAPPESRTPADRRRRRGTRLSRSRRNPRAAAWIAERHVANFLVATNLKLVYYMWNVQILSLAHGVTFISAQNRQRSQPNAVPLKRATAAVARFKENVPSKLVKLTRWQTGPLPLVPA